MAASRSAPSHSGKYSVNGSARSTRPPATRSITTVVVATGFVSDARSKIVVSVAAFGSSKARVPSASRQRTPPLSPTSATAAGKIRRQLRGGGVCVRRPRGEARSRMNTSGVAENNIGRRIQCTCSASTPAERRPCVCSRTSAAPSCRRRADRARTCRRRASSQVEKIVPPRHGGRARRRDDRPGGDLPRHRRRRPRGRCARRAARSCAASATGARIVVVNDALIALVAGAGERPASSSSPAPDRSPTAATRRGQAAARRRLGPHDRRRGQRLLDRPRGAGGGGARGRRPRAADARSPTTSSRTSACRTPPGWCAIVYDREVPRANVATLGPIVQRARDRGDAVATQILERAADELSLAAASVPSRLEMRGDAFSFVLAGGVFRVVPWLVERAAAAAGRGRAAVQRSSC